MVDYLEKQIILDYHFRGEQDIFEQDYPSLKIKAEKLLGYDVYFDLSPLTGAPLTEEENPELYSHLMKIQRDLNNELDEALKSHNIKLEQLNYVLEGGDPEDLKPKEVEVTTSEESEDLGEELGH